MIYSSSISRLKIFFSFIDFLFLIIPKHDLLHAYEYIITISRTFFSNTNATTLHESLYLLNISAI